VARRLLIGFVVLIAVAAVVGSAAADPSSRKQSVDSQLSQLRDQISSAQARESQLESEIASVTSEIRSLDHQVQDVAARLVVLERDLELHRARLARLTELYRLQTQRLIFLRRQYRVAVERLDRRLIALYQSEDIGTLEVVLSASSITDMIDRLDYIRDVGNQDRTISATVKDARIQMRIARQRTRKTKRVVAAATRVIAVRTAEVRAIHDELVARQSALVAAKGQKQSALSETHASTQQMLVEASALEQSSSALAAQIRTAQASSASSSSSSSSSSSGSSYSPGGPSSSGLIWPVSGPVVSTFGYRCLAGLCRMHEGIDIGVGSGTPIHAAASGTIIWASWQDGYGNLIVIDHGGGLSTAYAHQSSFAVSGGHVSQGQVIGYVGCTGRCFGPHLHFEVRVNGSAVDPLGYL
jgi:murein DD-endopeptidase MepM/ murein hydrolase activator NlpD